MWGSGSGNGGERGERVGILFSGSLSFERSVRGFLRTGPLRSARLLPSVGVVAVGWRLRGAWLEQSDCVEWAMRNGIV